LFFIRRIAMPYYGEEALGLGDIKLMAAAGVWLGPYYILLALACGALAGIFHGLWLAVMRFVKTREKVNFSRLSLPAGPGFITGIVIAGAFMLKAYPGILLS